MNAVEGAETHANLGWVWEGEGWNRVIARHRVIAGIREANHLPQRTQRVTKEIGQKTEEMVLIEDFLAADILAVANPYPLTAQ
jgi:hypothetical protein